ncbi:MAG: AmmeMemoRadiSam system protein B [candidate division KSB1 bacterium]|nr:AmmeMemoRadiSam system protein B [candidate division KSB1 bacterium]
MNIRPAYCAGTFYPADPDDLKGMVHTFLEQVSIKSSSEPVAGLISPHAGYPYSGPTAAVAYSQLQGREIKNVLVCSPSHMTPITGVSIFDGDYYETPLGRVPVNQEKAKELAAFADELTCSSVGHLADATGGAEHALEVQLPFLQQVLQDWTLIPLVFNEYKWSNCRVLGEAIASVFDPDDTLIVASSDLYHGHDYDQALKTDERTLNSIEAFDAKMFCEQSEQETIMACGAGPITALIFAAKKWNARAPRVLSHTTSADAINRTGGYVVGYAAVVIEK